MTVPAADTQKQRGQTSYHVIAQTDKGTPETPPKFSIVGESVHAANAEQAIRNFVAALKQPPNTTYYIAIPARSWKPQKVTVETATVVKVGEPA